MADARPPTPSEQQIRAQALAAAAIIWGPAQTELTAAGRERGADDVVRMARRFERWITDGLWL